MASIIRGTTPTLKYKFKIVEVSDITEAYLSIQNNNTMIEKTLEDAIVGTDFIAWTLSQSDTLALGNSITVMINWLLADGTRGASVKTDFMIADNFKGVVI